MVLILIQFGTNTNLEIALIILHNIIESISWKNELFANYVNKYSLQIIHFISEHTQINANIVNKLVLNFNPNLPNDKSDNFQKYFNHLQ